MKFSLRTLMVSVLLVALAIAGYQTYRTQRLWRNTRFDCEYDALVSLPSSTTFSTNRWVSTDIDIPTAHVGTGTWRDGRELLYFAQSPGMNGVTTLTIDGKVENAVIVGGYIRHWAAGGTVCHYTVLPEPEMPPDDGSRPSG